MKSFKKRMSIKSLFAVIIVIITGCGDRDIPVPTGVTATPGNGQVTIAWTAMKMSLLIIFTGLPLPG